MASRRDQLVGNRLALLGTVLYFMEWVVIPFAPSLPTDRLGHDPAATVAAYAEHPGTTALLAGWLSFVLLGRIAFCAGLRNAFRASPRELSLADWAFGAMVVSVAIDLLRTDRCGRMARRGRLRRSDDRRTGRCRDRPLLPDLRTGRRVDDGGLAGHADVRPVPALDRLVGPGGGSLVLAGGVVGASAAGSNGGFHDIGSALNGLPLFGFWVWIIATSVVLFRHAPREGARNGPPVEQGTRHTVSNTGA